MMIRKLQSGPIAERARRSAREIALAVVLTFAALVFVIAAVHRGASETASISAPESGVENRSN
jgi:cytochrome bd-type quinol oxidase subunit 2